MASGDVALGRTKAIAAVAPAEAGLVEGCRRGDPQAFSRVVALHEGMVFGLAVRLLGDPEEARDVAQDVFLQVYRALERFEGRSSLKTWIYRIVVNQCRNRRRFWRRRRRAGSFPIEELTPADEARVQAERAESESPFEGVARVERAARVQAALHEISFDHRAVLLLREVDGLGCDEIAAALGIPEGTVKSRLARAREAFRERLTARLREERT